MFNWGLQRIKSALWQNLWCCTAVWAQNWKDRKGNDIMLHLWSISYAQTHVMFPAFWIPVYILMIWQLWVLILHLKEFRAFHHHNTRGAEEGFVWLLSVLYVFRQQGQRAGRCHWSGKRSSVILVGQLDGFGKSCHSQFWDKTVYVR